MKKIYSPFFAIVMLATSSKIEAQCSNSVTAGSSSNMFTQIRWTTNPVAVNKDLNTIVFAHRNNASLFGGSSGHFRYDVSTNAGTTWTVDVGNLNPSLISPGRYPNALIYNPPANTNPTNAYIGYLGATINSVSAAWNGHVSGVRQLNGTGNTENYNQAGGVNVLIPNSLTKGNATTYWAADAVYTGTVVSGFRAYKGVWNGSNDINWSQNFSVTPTFNTLYNGNNQIADYNIAFDPTGNFGWLSFLSHTSGGPTNYAYYPNFYKTTDGGVSWVGPIQVDLNQFSCISALITPPNVASCAFEHDLTVDINGNPHMLVTIGNGNNTYSMFFGSTKRMFDITQLNGVWNAYDIANVNAGRGTFGIGTNSTTIDMFPQISRTADGKKIFFNWTDNSTYTLGQANQTPNLFSRAFDVTTNLWTNVKDFTACNPGLNGQILYPHIADEVLQPTPTSYKMAGVYAIFTVPNDPGSPVNLRFLDNLTFTNADFTIPQPVASVSIAQGSNWLLCPSSTASLSISGSFSQVLWSSGAVTNSTTASSSGTYIVTARNGCTIGADTISVINLTTSISPTAAAVCSGNSSTLNVSTNAITYTWQPMNLSTSSVVVTPTASTVYTLAVSGTSCVASNSVNLIVNVNPTISISGPTAACSGVVQTYSASGANSYTWSNGATTTSVVITPSATTIYSVIGTSTANCSNSSTFALNVNPTPTITIAGTQTICAGASSTLTGSGASTYTWNTGANNNPIIFSPTTTTTYTLSGAASNSCIGTRTITVNVNSLPTISVTSNSSLVCVGNSATLTATGANTYTWTGNQNGSSIVVSPTITTTYTLIGTNTLNCNNNASFTQSVSPCAGIAEVTLESQVLIYPNPNNGLFIVKSPVSGLLKLVSVSGQILTSINYKAGELINLNEINLAKGIYFLSLETNQGTANKKLIIN